MHACIPHLLADIRAAHRNREPGVDEVRPSMSIEEVLEEVERWATGPEPEHTFGYYCGLEVGDFPQPEQLSHQDLERVCDSFRELLFSWNADISLPDALPLPLRYQFMVKTLDERFTLVKAGFITFDYCSGYAPDCPFKEYCSCLEFWNSSKSSFNRDTTQRKNALN